MAWSCVPSLDIALALRGRDQAGRSQLELLGVALDRGWPSLICPLHAAAAARIAVHDGERGIARVLERALPGVPQQICTFHLRDSFDHRLWQDGLAFGARRALARAWGNALEYAGDATRASAALAAMRKMAERHRWRRTDAHLRTISPHATTWLELGTPTHTTSLLERVMREVNRRVDPVGVRWSPRWRGRDHRSAARASLPSPRLAPAVRGFGLSSGLGRAPMSQRTAALSVRYS